MDEIIKMFAEAVEKLRHGKPVVIKQDPLRREWVVKSGTRLYCIADSEMSRMFESDKKGLDAGGLDTFGAMLLDLAMRLDGVPADRIPPIQSGTRLSSQGRDAAEMIANEFNRLDS